MMMKMRNVYKFLAIIHATLDGDKDGILANLDLLAGTVGACAGHLLTLSSTFVTTISIINKIK